MAWLRCSKAKPADPMPVGTTYTNQWSRSAPIETYHASQNRSLTLNTINVASLKVQVNYSIQTYASSVYDPSSTWQSEAVSEGSFTFAVNGTTYLSTPNIIVWSRNDGWQSSSGSATYTITGLPRGNCVFNYNIFINSVWQNGGQLDPRSIMTLSFKITEVTYK